MIVDSRENNRVETLRRRINDEAYLHAAIQRLALVLSKELSHHQCVEIISAQKIRAQNMRRTLFAKGGRNERQRERRK